MLLEIKLIKSSTKRMVCCGSSEVPLANQTVYISCHRERTSQCLFRKGEAVARLLVLGSDWVELMSEPGAVFSCYQPGSRWAAVGSCYIALSKADSFFGDSVYMRCGDLIISLTTKFSIAQIIRKQNDQVGHFGNPIPCVRNRF